MNVTRSIVYGVVGPRLSQISFRPLPKCCEQLQSPVTSFLNPRQRKLKVAAIRFLADEALANVQRLLEKGAGLLALAEGTQEIAHTLIGDGEAIEMSPSLPLWASMNFSVLTNIPPEPQQGS